MKIFITKNGKRKGPYSPAQLKDMLARSEISMSDRAWYEGCAEWSRIQEMPELIKEFSKSAPPPKPKPKPQKSSPPFFQTKILPRWQKFKTQRTLQLAIVCVTALLALWIWRWTDRSSAVSPSIDGTAAEVNLSAIQAAIKKDRELEAIMLAKRKVITANTDESLNAIGLLIKTYSTNALRIDLTTCPRDFGEACTRVFVAWQAEGEAISKHPHIPEGYGPIVEGFFRNLEQDVIDTMTEPPDSMADWFDEVTSAEHTVQDAQRAADALAIKYGVRPAR